MIEWFCRFAVLLAASGLSGQSPEGLITFNDDGAWCWFQDERAIIHQGKLLIGSVAAGAHDLDRKGDVDVVTYDLATGKQSLTELHHYLAHGNNEYDDHNAPAFVVRPDGRVLAVYAKHGPENVFYYRITESPDDPSRWRPVRAFSPSESSRITYSNLFRLSGENRVYNFFRGLDNSWKPSYAYSDDGGESWTPGNIVIDVPAERRHRPYVKYASNGVDSIHLLYTEAHPHVYNTSIYHLYYREGKLYRSDGSTIRGLREGLKKPEEGTRIFPGDPNQVAWTCDLALDDNGHPYAAFSVQVDGEGIPIGAGGLDHRYYYARWDGSKWHTHQMAYAGTRLYWHQDHYTGNVALDPDDPNTVYISTNADPATGEPLRSRADGGRHFEIYRGVTADGGASWQWIAITQNSRADNLRPIVPVWDGEHTALLWMRGTYTTYMNYDLDIVGLISRAGEIDLL